MTAPMRDRPSVIPDREPAGCLWTILLAGLAWAVLVVAALVMFEAVR